MSAGIIKGSFELQGYVSRWGFDGSIYMQGEDVFVEMKRALITPLEYVADSGRPVEIAFVVTTEVDIPALATGGGNTPFIAIPQGSGYQTDEKATEYRKRGVVVMARPGQFRLVLENSSTINLDDQLAATLGSALEPFVGSKKIVKASGVLTISAVSQG